MLAGLQLKMKTSDENKPLGTKDKIALCLFFGVFGTLFLVPGLIALYFAAQGIAGEYQTRNWLQTDGMVASSEVFTNEVKSASGTPVKTQRARIVYTYKIGNSIFASDRVSFSSEANRAPSLVDNYPKGKKVTVYYSPDNPSSAVLEPKTARDIWLARALWIRLGFAILFIGVGLFLFYTLRTALKYPPARH